MDDARYEITPMRQFKRLTLSAPTPKNGATQRVAQLMLMASP